MAIVAVVAVVAVAVVVPIAADAAIAESSWASKLSVDQTEARDFVGLD